MKVLVKNVNGTSRFTAPDGYDSWLDYWEKQSGKHALYCSATDCPHSTNLVGAHVQKVDSTDRCYYIVPLCNACNQRTESFYVDTQLVPVPSNN